ncbi:MAG: hypothetical protein OXE54_03235 [Gammaproteobacteria bacterium]|nr:hypothetical protein [Gammaproteobacteria bacterium]MCY4295968.1 hypothetical protein [Gammaproteobacteria bacterium]
MILHLLSSFGPGFAVTPQALSALSSGHNSAAPIGRFSFARPKKAHILLTWMMGVKPET